jgi:hypothetical protein
MQWRCFCVHVFALDVHWLRKSECQTYFLFLRWSQDFSLKQEQVIKNEFLRLHSYLLAEIEKREKVEDSADGFFAYDKDTNFFFLSYT